LDVGIAPVPVVPNDAIEFREQTSVCPWQNALRWQAAWLGVFFSDL